MNPEPGTTGNPVAGTANILPEHGHLLRNLMLFGRLLRELGLDVTPTQILDLVGGLEHIDIGWREDFKNTARALLVHHHEHLALFDRAFDLFWQARERGELGRWEMGKLLRKPPPRSQPIAQPGTAGQGGSEQQTDQPVIDIVLTYSAEELLRHKDFERLTPEETAVIERLMQAMTWNLEQRRTRRKIHASRGTHLDMRRTLRQNLRYGGEPIRLAWRRRKFKRRPLVVICDISGSMERYSRLFLQFIYLISNGLEQVEAFAFSTRLTRITHPLQERNVDQALHEATRAIQDWGGGTRIGEALKTFNYEWSRRVLGQGAIVLIISDGWDRGDIDLLGREMSRLQRSCHRLIWLNPLLGGEDYQPLTRGIQAALPYVDDFLPVHNLHSLEQLGNLLERLSEYRPVRRQEVQNRTRAQRVELSGEI